MYPESHKILYDVAARLLLDGKCDSIQEGINAVRKYTGLGDEAARDQSFARMSWDEYFMTLAFLVARRSPDAQTQHGTVIVDQNNKIVATGYNGFLPGVPDTCMPNLRPLKYQHIMHAEVNAILSAAQNLEKCRIYITGLPCNDCLKVIAKTGMKNIIVGDLLHKFADGYFEQQALVCVMNNIRIQKYVGKLTHLEGRFIMEENHVI